MKKLFEIPLNRQVYLTFGVICLVLALIGGLLFFSLLNIERQYRRAVGELSESAEKMERRMASGTAGLISRTRIVADELLGGAIVITIWAGMSVMKMERRLRRDNRDLKTMISERKNTEAAMRESETRLRAIFETEPECVKVVSREGTLLEMNPAGLAMLQACSLAEAQQKALADFIVPEHRKAFLTLHQRAMAGKSGILEFEITGLKGRRRWLETHATPLRNSAGEVQSLLGITRDITRRKEIEALNHLLTTQLEARVVERTGELQLVNKELEAFSYSVSHDLRAPLRQITGFVKLLQKDAGPALSEKSVRFLTTVSGSAQRMGALIDDLLAFSQIGRATLQKAVVNLHQLTLEAVADIQSEIKARQVKWLIDPLPALWADRSLLRLVLVNLISNAVKFTGNRAEAKIEIGCLPGGAAETVIFVRDNGAGFNPKYIDKLFGVFQRLHSQAEFEGTGIGLANVQRIINRHGGRVWAEGAEDRGATFYFSLPKQPEGNHEH